MSLISLFLIGTVIGIIVAVLSAFLFALHLVHFVRNVMNETIADAERDSSSSSSASTLQPVTERTPFLLLGARTTPAMKALVKTKMILRVNNDVASVTEHQFPDRRPCFEFNAHHVILHLVAPAKIEIEALSCATDVVAHVVRLGGATGVAATRIVLEFAFPHEAAIVFGRLLARGAGLVGGSVFLARAERHLPSYFKFLASLPRPATQLTAATLMFARVLGASNDVRALHPFLLNTMKAKLEQVDLPKPIKGKLEIVGLKLGRNSPAVGDIRVVNAPLRADDGSVELALDVEYGGGFELSLSVALEVDSFVSVTLPSVTVTLRVDHLSAVMRLLLLPPPARHMWLAFETAPKVKLSFYQKVHGANAAVQKFADRFADLSETITNVVRHRLVSDMVLPKRDSIPLPIIGGTPPTTPVETESNNSAAMFEAFREARPSTSASADSAPSLPDVPSAAAAFSDDKKGRFVLPTTSTTSSGSVEETNDDDDAVPNDSSALSPPVGSSSTPPGVVASRTVSRRLNLGMAAAAILLIAVLVLNVWLCWPSSSSSTPTANNSAVNVMTASGDNINDGGSGTTVSTSPRAHEVESATATGTAEQQQCCDPAKKPVTTSVSDSDDDDEIIVVIDDEVSNPSLADEATTAAATATSASDDGDSGDEDGVRTQEETDDYVVVPSSQRDDEAKQEEQAGQQSKTDDDLLLDKNHQKPNEVDAKAGEQNEQKSESQTTNQKEEASSSTTIMTTGLKTNSDQAGDDPTRQFQHDDVRIDDTTSMNQRSEPTRESAVSDPTPQGGGMVEDSSSSAASKKEELIGTTSSDDKKPAADSNRHQQLDQPDRQATQEEEQQQEQKKPDQQQQQQQQQQHRQQRQVESSSSSSTSDTWLFVALLLPVVIAALSDNETLKSLLGSRKRAV